MGSHDVPNGNSSVWPRTLGVGGVVPCSSCRRGPRTPSEQSRHSSASLLCGVAQKVLAHPTVAVGVAREKVSPAVASVNRHSLAQVQQACKPWWRWCWQRVEKKRAHPRFELGLTWLVAKVIRPVWTNGGRANLFVQTELLQGRCFIGRVGGKVVGGLCGAASVVYQSTAARRGGRQRYEAVCEGAARSLQHR